MKYYFDLKIIKKYKNHVSLGNCTKNQAVGQILSTDWSLLTAEVGIFLSPATPQPGCIKCPSSRLPACSCAAQSYTALAAGHPIYPSLPREPGAIRGGHWAPFITSPTDPAHSSAQQLYTRQARVRAGGLSTAPCRRHNCKPHLTDVESEAQRGPGINPTSHSHSND